MSQKRVRPVTTDCSPLKKQARIYRDADSRDWNADAFFREIVTTALAPHMPTDLASLVALCTADSAHDVPRDCWSLTQHPQEVCAVCRDNCHWTKPGLIFQALINAEDRFADTDDCDDASGHGMTGEWEEQITVCVDCAENMARCLAQHKALGRHADKVLRDD
jgi:hypothetical protein